MRAPAHSTACNRPRSGAPAEGVLSGASLDELAAHGVAAIGPDKRVLARRADGSAINATAHGWGSTGVVERIQGKGLQVRVVSVAAC